MNRLKISLVFSGRILLLLLFIGYYISITMFYHTHVVNGVVITHSHPFRNTEKNGAAGSHSHSASQYILIQHFCETSITDAILDTPVIPAEQIACCFELYTPITDHFSSNILSKESSRAPPVF